jgi:pyruvate,water dikinase
VSDDPIHYSGPTAAEWTTVNASEALPGVATPLTWTWYAAAVEWATRGAFADMGVVPTAFVPTPANVDERFAGMFYGRLVLNVDMFRQTAERVPGSSAEAFDEQFFAGKRSGVTGERSWPVGRIPAIAAKLPVNVRRAERTVRERGAAIELWWQRQVAAAAGLSPAELRAGLEVALEHYRVIVRAHALISFVAQGLYERIRSICERAGRPGLELRLIIGQREVYETRTISDLWDVAQGRLPLEHFLVVHGFHGPAEGELSSHSWREDPTPLEPLIDAYHRKRSADRPDRIHGQREVDWEEALAELKAQLGRVAAAQAALVLRLAQRYIPLREEGRAAFLKTYDVARCFARHLGDHLVAEGRLGDREDVFYLTFDELLDPGSGDLRAEVAFRRVRRDEYLQVECPQRFRGQPQTVALRRPAGAVSANGAAAGGAAALISAVGASPGVVEGRAAVVTDACDPGDIGPGDILVCRTTDPSWAALFFAVSGCVIDVGGPMSHGAILARELGLPCVIGTVDGTERLRSGDRIRVDGGAGTVQVLAAQEAS